MPNERRISDFARPPLWLNVIASILLITIVGVFRLYYFAGSIVPIGFGVPLLLFAYLRSRIVLWVTACAFAVFPLLKYWSIESSGGPLSPGEHPHVLLGFSLVQLDLWIIATLVHVLIGIRERMETRNAELVAANAGLAAREEDIARQNEELQIQAEELQRQSEELRINNEELTHRERTLEILLTLSRSLKSDLSKEQALGHICQTLADVLATPGTKAAVLEVDGDLLRVRCHHGFGPDGIEDETLPVADSFTSLVLSRGRTAYVDDLAQRPDLRCIQPKAGPPIGSIIAAPLRVEGSPVGTLELYNCAPMAWNDDHVRLIESLATQASVSLETGQLFNAVAQERLRLETILRTMPFGVAVGNRDATDIRLNPAGAAMFNVAVNTNVADPQIRNLWRMFHDGKPLTADQFPMTRALREGQEIHAGEIDIALPGGRGLVLLVNSAPIRDRGGRIVGAVSAFADITPQKELQRELDVRRREAEEASIRKTRFLAAVSHDIRTPANAISLLAELLQRTACDPRLTAEIPDLARELHASAMSLVNLLSDVLDLARFDSGRIDIHETEFSLGEFLSEQDRRMLPLAREKGISLIVRALAEPVRIRSDRIKLSRILDNLIGNAIKFTEAGTVTVTVEAAPDTGVKIEVRDTGIGIAPEHQRHIFDEFFQLRNPERDRDKGTGLGLTICKRLVDAMGATLRLNSAADMGSSFIVNLPARCIVQQVVSKSGPG